MSGLDLPTPFWMIGCGNMAGAMLARWLDCGADPGSVTVIRPSGAPVAPGVEVLTTPPAGERPALVLLGVKPQKLDDVASAYGPLLGGDTILISILAGVEQASLRARFPQARAIVRAMPNTPVAVGKGATALYSEDADPGARGLAERMMAALGRAEWITDESLFDVVAALTASGPAFVFRFIDALAAAAAELGLPPAQAGRLAVATVEGAAVLASASSETPARLADRVASPGGMTRQGLDVLDQGDALRRLVHATIDAATRHSRKMGEAARRG